MRDGEEIIAHPAYGQIRFQRTSGRARFYGSELTQNDYITMELHESTIHKSLTNESFFEGSTIVRVRMSHHQFSEMITSMNRGQGVPCTIERLGGQKMEDLPEVENRKEFVHRKFEERMSEFANTLKTNSARAEELIAKKTLNKEDQRELGWIIKKMIQETSSNIPFFGKCFQENMDEVVQEAKKEIEGSLQHKIHSLGLEKLHEQQNLLLDDGNK